MQCVFCRAYQLFQSIIIRFQPNLATFPARFVVTFRLVFLSQHNPKIYWIPKSRMPILHVAMHTTKCYIRK